MTEKHLILIEFERKYPDLFTKLSWEDRHTFAELLQNLQKDSYDSGYEEGFNEGLCD